MLTALKQGVKGGKWFSLIDKVYAPDNLAAAFTRVAANGGAAGGGHQTGGQYERNLNAKQEKRATQLRDGSYCAQAGRGGSVNQPRAKKKNPPRGPAVREPGAA